MAKITISVKVNYDNWKKARDRRLNISKVCDKALEKAVEKIKKKG